MSDVTFPFGGAPTPSLALVNVDGVTIVGDGVDEPLSSVGAGLIVPVSFVASGGEQDFTVGGFSMPDTSYGLWWAPASVSAVPQLALPNGVGDRTKTTFRVNATAPLVAGDTLTFFLSP